MPLLGQRDHGACVQHAKPKEVVELQAHAVHCPMEAVLGIKQRVALRSQHRQMLNVAPSQLRTEKYEWV